MTNISKKYRCKNKTRATRPHWLKARQIRLKVCQFRLKTCQIRLKTLSTWRYPDLRSQVKNQCPFWRTCDSERRSSYLNLKRTRWQLTCLRSITKRSFLPSAIATAKELMQKEGSLCSVIQLLSKSSEIAWTTKSGCLRADKLLLKKNTGLGNWQKESDSHAKWYQE